MKHKKQRRRSLRRKRKKRAETAGTHTEAAAPRNETGDPETTARQEADGASRDEPPSR